MCAEDKQCIEPTASLIYALGYKVGRIGALELLLVLEWIVLLRVWHTGLVMNFKTAGHKLKTYLPDSNQQSKTGSTRLRVPLPCDEGIVM